MVKTIDLKSIDKLSERQKKTLLLLTMLPAEGLTRPRFKKIFDLNSAETDDDIDHLVQADLAEENGKIIKARPLDSGQMAAISEHESLERELAYLVLSWLDNSILGDEPYNPTIGELSKITKNLENFLKGKEPLTNGEAIILRKLPLYLHSDREFCQADLDAIIASWMAVKKMTAEKRQEYFAKFDELLMGKGVIDEVKSLIEDEAVTQEDMAKFLHELHSELTSSSDLFKRHYSYILAKFIEAI